MRVIGLSKTQFYARIAMIVSLAALFVTAVDGTFSGEIPSVGVDQGKSLFNGQIVAVLGTHLPASGVINLQGPQHGVVSLSGYFTNPGGYMNVFPMGSLGVTTASTAGGSGMGGGVVSGMGM
jgi:hypothetical protein